MDVIIEISKLRNFKHPEEIIKTLNIGNCKCDIKLEDVLNKPVLPPLSYTNDCLRFITLIRHQNGIHVAKECAKAYRRA